MAIVRMTMEDIKKTSLTDEEVEMLKQAAKEEPVIDDDCPSYSIEDMKRLMKVAEDKRAEKNITLHLSQQAFAEAEALGKEYNSVLSKVVEKLLIEKKITNFL